MTPQPPIDRLTPDQRRELLSQLLRQRQAQRPPSPQSLTQRRLWLLDQMGLAGTAYNIVAYQKVAGLLHVESVENAIAMLIQLHETLRTTFSNIAGNLVQTVAPTLAVPLTQLDFQASSGADRQASLRQAVEHEQKTPFNLSTGPLFRVVLIKLAAEEHILLVAMHHIISDGWSVGLFARHFWQAYGDLAAGKPVQLPTLPIQYADFSKWQAQWLETPSAEAQLGYWKDHLQGASDFELPTDRPRPSQPRLLGDEVSLVLDSATSAAVRGFAESRRVTVAMLIHAAFSAVLARWSGQSDIVIGATIANRNRAECENLIGFFVNILVLRLNFDGNPSFDNLVSRASEVAFQAYANQDIPFEYLVERLAPRRDSSRNPFFQIALAVQNAPMTPPVIAGLTLSSLYLPGFTVNDGRASLGVTANAADEAIKTRHTRFDIEMHVWDRPDTLAATFVFDTDLFDAGTIASLAESVSTFIRAAIASPDVSFKDLSLLSSAASRKLAEWGTASSMSDPGLSVADYFKRQVARTPDAIAVIDGPLRWSYRQLDVISDHIAATLVQGSVRMGDRVGLLLNRCAWTIASMLGILKTGAVYVPLDPSYPEVRLKFMSGDSGCRTVITSNSFDPAKLAATAAKAIFIEDLYSTADRPASFEKMESARGADPAYIIYTSGSTGEPKGVIIPHRGITRLVIDPNYVSLGPAHSLLHMAPVVFDASTFEIWGALLTGASCVCYPAAVPSPRELAEFIAKSRVTTLFITTALFNAVIDYDPRAFAPLSQLLFGGEMVSPRHVKLAHSALPNTRLLHVYGPTEVTTFSTCYHVSSVDERAATIPIGRPISATAVLIVDPHNRLAPPRAPGEVLLGGDGVALGYLERLKLSSECFITLPDHPGRWYRSGDLGRWNAAGQIEILGRKDQQVKVHGFRIELGEIEAALSASPGINRAAVVAVGEGADKRLVAYVVAEEGASLNVDLLRSALRQRLPDYMIPAQYIDLPTLPLNANGKIDKASLPAPDAHRRLSTAAILPASELQQRLAAIWRDALQLKEVGITDNFFDLGGHSLLLVQIHERIVKDFPIRLPVVDLFQFPTIQDLAQRITQIQSAPTPGGEDAATDRAHRQRQALARAAAGGNHG